MLGKHGPINEHHSQQRLCRSSWMRLQSRLCSWSCCSCCSCCLFWLDLKAVVLALHLHIKCFSKICHGELGKDPGTQGTLSINLMIQKKTLAEHYVLSCEMGHFHCIPQECWCSTHSKQKSAPSISWCDNCGVRSHGSTGWYLKLRKSNHHSAP